MNPWPFIIAAYALDRWSPRSASTWWSWAAMRRAEAEADALSERP